MLYTELQPKLYNQKSYYGKALIGQSPDAIHLYSYGTNMLTIYNGKVVHMNPVLSDYTQTTLKHVKDFLYQTLGIKGLTKKDILKMRYERWKDLTIKKR